MPTPYSPGSGKAKPSPAHSRDKNSCGNLNQDACPVARLGIAAASAAMGQIDQDLDALLNDFMRFLARSG